MLTEAEALQLILSRVRAPETTEQLPIAAALGRFASATTLATVSSPSFDNSQVDGYAVRAADGHTGASLTVTQEQPAGVQRELHLQSGQAIRIFTGAAIPEGADAVVMQEDVRREADQITMLEAVTLNENIRRTGSDLCEGQVLLRPGDRITPVLVGVLASQGLSGIAVRCLPCIGVLTTGDELIVSGTPLQQGQLYNSNGPMLSAMLASLGISSVAVKHCGDTLAATIEALTELLAQCDAVIIAGGVSVGDHDHVKPALAALNMTPDLWRVKIKPGKPFLFAQSTDELRRYVFGLPGNPVSAFVTFHRFVRPALLKLMGANDANQRETIVTATLTDSLTNEGDRPHYIRGQVIGGAFTPVGLQQSHALYGLSRCNALLCLKGNESLPAGSACAVSLV